MTLSIIRRFAKYHGIDIGDRDSSLAILHIATLFWVPREEPLDVARDKIVQSLTRIEDAEAILDSAPTQTEPAYTRGYRRAVLDIGESMVRRAGIDPERWAHAKE